MAINVGFQMDPIEGLNLKQDTTLAIITECLSRNFNVFHFLPKNVSYADGEINAFCKKILEVNKSKSPFYKLGLLEQTNLKKMDLIFVRQDPPFDIPYITSTFLLEYIENDVSIINRPSQIRNSPEKLFLNKWKHLTPKTLISRNYENILNFREKYENIIIKPLYSNGGSGIFYLKKNDKNFNSIIEMFLEKSSDQFIVQEYVEEIKKGDKRIILFNGEPVGAINRVPSDNDIRANLHVGGVAEKTSLTERENEICNEIGPTLVEKGLVFAGIDVIGGKLTEINVTSPTGFREIFQFDGVNLAKKLLKIILK
tara:strand:- start:475 stop:1410 length:936 start_codon:yes stop_codon:yes gene_type:complete